MPTIDVISANDIPNNVVEFITTRPMPSLFDASASDEATRECELLLDSEGLRGTLTEAALWLLIGELDRSHEVSQTDNSTEGSFWHGIMHRREGDYWNSKYWFRKVAGHKVLRDLADLISKRLETALKDELPFSAMCQAQTVADAYVDAVEDLAGQGKDQLPDHRTQLEIIAWWEWQLLFAHSK